MGVSREFQECFKSVSRKFQGCFMKLSRRRKFQECFKGVSIFSSMFPECFKSVSRMFQENFQGVSKKFHVAWHSSQLPEQKEGLFIQYQPGGAGDTHSPPATLHHLQRTKMATRVWK